MMYIRLALSFALLLAAGLAFAQDEGLVATDGALQAMAPAEPAAPLTGEVADGEQAPPAGFEGDTWSRESEGLQLMGACEDQCWAANAQCRAQCPKRMPYFEWCMSANCWPALDACLAAC